MIDMRWWDQNEGFTHYEPRSSSTETDFDRWWNRIDYTLYAHTTTNDNKETVIWWR